MIFWKYQKTNIWGNSLSKTKKRKKIKINYVIRKIYRFVVVFRCVYAQNHRTQKFIELALNLGGYIRIENICQGMECFDYILKQN
jgi:hypothetical protein